MKRITLLCAGLVAAVLAASPAVAGNFSVSGGKIIDPAGRVWHGRGINGFTDGSTPNAMALMSTNAAGSPVTALFPKINFIRMPVYSYQDPSVYARFVEHMTGLGIVVEFEDHPFPMTNPYTGAKLIAETKWYASMAAYYKGNPYVWFGTENEVQSQKGQEAQHKAIYDAIRGAGNHSMIVICPYGGGNPGSIGTNGYGGGMNVATYLTMTNIVWDLHFYGWQTDKSTVQAVNYNLMAWAGIGIAGVVGLGYMFSNYSKVKMLGKLAFNGRRRRTAP